MLKHLAVLAVLVGGASAARAQEAARSIHFDAVDFEPQQNTRFKPSSLIGVRAGFVMAMDAEEAVPFFGLGARLPIADVAAIEFSVDFWTDEYEDGDAEVFHMPLMISAMFYFPIETPSTTPYIMAGVGMHSLEFEYSGSLGAEDDDSDSEFAFHAGAGLEMTLTSSLRVHMDVRWIMMDPDPSAAGVEDTDFEAVQFSFALSLRF
jgi:opacity protein-like surface antigen